MSQCHDKYEATGTVKRSEVRAPGPVTQCHDDYPCEWMIAEADLAAMERQAKEDEASHELVEV